MMDLRTLIDRVDEVLRGVWDPIGVNHEREAGGEYSSYAPGVARLLVSGAPDAEIEGHLADIVQGRMGMSQVNPRRVSRTLAALRELPLR
jgi:hypothetical protein